MNPLTLAEVLGLVIKYGPGVLSVIQKLIADIEAGKGNQVVTSADIAELMRLGSLTAGDIFKREGVALPPIAQ